MTQRSNSRQPPSLRPARGADAGEMGSISRDYIELGLPWSWTGDRVRAALGDPDTAGVVAVRERHLAGFAVMRFGEHTAALMLLAVRPRYRRQGVGGTLLDWLDTSARTAGMERVTLEVRSDNSGALRFYLGAGYHVIDYLPGYYHGQAAALRMSKSLTVGTRAPVVSADRTVGETDS